MTDHIPDTKKEVQPMTLDEPIAEFNNLHKDLANYVAPSLALETARGWNSALSLVVKHIRENREALEAGMRGKFLPLIDELDRLKYIVCEEDSASIERVLDQFVEDSHD